jgi:hypothetical protein
LSKRFSYSHASEGKTLVLPDVLTQGDIPAELAMKPVFDLVWQSAGFRGNEVQLGVRHDFDFIEPHHV